MVLLPSMVKEMPGKGRVAKIKTACMVGCSLCAGVTAMSCASRSTGKVQC